MLPKVPDTHYEVARAIRKPSSESHITPIRDFLRKWARSDKEKADIFAHRLGNSFKLNDITPHAVVLENNKNKRII